MTFVCFFLISNVVKKYKQQLGAWGEDIAKSYYQKLGYQIIAQNFSTRYGELDLVFIKANKILVVEVKTRSSLAFGFAEESISRNKLQNLRTAYQILSRRNSLPADFEMEICVVEKINQKKASLNIKLKKSLTSGCQKRNHKLSIISAFGGH